MIDRPRRSVLYLPASNARAVAKARSLPVDCLILDLEDAVAPDAKAAAREAALATLKDRASFGHRELIVRTNATKTPWGEADLVALAGAQPDAILLPKVSSPAEVESAAAILAEAGGPAEQAIWCMLETASGVARVDEIAAHPRVRAIVLGTSDLSRELRVRPTRGRQPLLYALQRCLLAARAAGCVALDGVHLDLADNEGLKLACQEGRDMGFDGKTLIHPSQIAAANAAFGPDKAEIELARRTIEAFAAAQAKGTYLALLEGRLIEALHVEEARRILDMAEAIAAQERS